MRENYLKNQLCEHAPPHPVATSIFGPLPLLLFGSAIFPWVRVGSLHRSPASTVGSLILDSVARGHGCRRPRRQPRIRDGPPYHLQIALCQLE